MDRWERVCAVFDAVADQPEHAWEEIVSRETGGDSALHDEVMRILTAEREDRFRLDHPKLLIDDPVEETRDGAERVGQTIARYRVVRLIGSGGMGTVYEGVRADDAYEQRVAIKLIRSHLSAAGMTSRFRRERQILAALEHRNIARLLDGGGTDQGEPFFVMEYVEGTPITTYCDEHRLTIAERLRLFLQACSAVQHAHGKLVVHRDLKPANILVAVDGSVKLLDFGVAKLLGAQDGATDGGDVDGLNTVTQIGTRALTPEYASPEQLRDEPASAASDVYSLGIVLYELLAGKRPFQITARSPVAALRALETDPPRPSTAVTENAALRTHEPSVARLRRRLAGELDNIVRKAIRAEPERRYTSAEQLAADIRRYLDGQPVAAQPDSAAYRARKFTRRHLGAVTAAAIAVIVLVGGIIATTVQAHRADAEARRAGLERMKGARITAFLQNMLSAPDTRWAVRGVRPASQITVSDVLDDAGRRAGVDLATEPAVESAVRQTLGRTYTAIGRYDQAVGQLTRVLAIERAIGAPPIPDIVSDVHDLAMAQFRLDHYHTADTLFRSALQVCQTHDQRADTAHVCGHSINDLGLVTMLENRLPEAEQLFRQVLAIARQIYGPSSPAVAIVLGNLAIVRDSRGDLAGAERLFRQAGAVYAKAGGREFPEKGYALEHLAGVLATEGRFSEAEPLFRQAMEIALRTESPYHPDVGFGWVHLGAIHRSMGKLALAQVETARGMSILTAAGTGARHYSIRANTYRALLLVALGQPHEAVPILASVLDTAATEFAADDPRVAEVQDALGQALLASGQSARALPLFSISHATFLHSFGPTHPRTIGTEQHLKAARGTRRRTLSPDLHTVSRRDIHLVARLHVPRGIERIVVHEWNEGAVHSR